MKEKCNTIHLMGNIFVGRPPEKVPSKTNNGDTTTNTFTAEEKMEMEKQSKLYFARRKCRNADLQAKTENVNLEEHIGLHDFLGTLMARNRAIQTHLIAFCSITHYAIDNHCRIGYGEYRKRISKDGNIKREWRNIRAWLAKNTTHNITAVTIGVGKRGYVYIRFLTTNYKDLAVYDVATDLGYYLRHKKHYTPVEFKPYEKNPMQFIKDKYNNDDIHDTEELINWIPDELWQVMRASFVLPYTHKTFKNTGANDAIQDNSRPVSYRHIWQGQDKQVSEKAYSSFLEKDNKDYSIPAFEKDIEPNEDEEFTIDADVEF